MRILRIGDPHVRPDNIEESERLMEFILQKVHELGIEQLEFMGDQHHTHAVMRMEVIHFWKKWATKFAKIIPTVFIVGNHDQPGDYEREQVMNAMVYFEGIDEGITVVNKPLLSRDTLYIPHMSKEEDFKKVIDEMGEGAQFLVCHQDFNGCQYESGTYSKYGFDPKIVKKFRAVISGHIHKQQTFANIFYLGTPRWDTVSDANEKKGIWMFEGDETTFISTNGVCSPIISIVLNEGEQIPEIPPGRVFVTLIGSSAWISSVGKILKGKVRIIPKPTDAQIRAKVSNDKLSSMEDYATYFNFNPEVTPDQILSYLKGLV